MMEEEYGITFGMHKVTLEKFYLDLIVLWELGYPAQIASGSLTLQGELGAIILRYCVCGPFAAWGAHKEEE
jgi:hypothetical protein